MLDLVKDLWETDVARRIIISIGVILVALIIWFIVKKIINSYRKKTGVDKIVRPSSSVQYVIYDTIKVTVFLILVITILQINGVNVTSLVAGVGVASAVIGLALQDFLKDIIMGVHVLMDNFYQLGDLVKYEDEEGIVEEFNLRTTKIRSIASGDLITICNRNINYIAKSSPEVYLHINLPYEVPVERAHKVMERIAEEARKDEEIEDCLFLGTTGFESSAMDYLLKVVCGKPEWKLRCRRSALKTVQIVLEDEHIEIPFTQMDVHMK